MDRRLARRKVRKAGDEVSGETEKAFGQAMQEVYRRAKVEAGYNATYFLGMLTELGPLDTAKRLVSSTSPSEGFTKLWEKKRLDLTVEAQVLRAEFAELLSDEEIDAARRRLDQYGS